MIKMAIILMAIIYLLIMSYGFLSAVGSKKICLNKAEWECSESVCINKKKDN